MKMKKFVALALAAVMAVSVLAGCGGGGSGVSGSLSSNKVESQLKEVDVEIDLTIDSHMNNTVRSAAEELANGSSQSAVRNKIIKDMSWDPLSIIQNAWNQLLNGLGILTPKASFGLVQIVDAQQLETNQGAGGLASMVGAHRDKVAAMAPINTPEKYAAALVLAVDGTVGQFSENENSRVNVSYNVSGYKVKDQNDKYYWIFAAQVTIA